MRHPKVVVSLVLLMLSGCKGCVEQHDPTNDWERFKSESNQANQAEAKLTDEGEIPATGGEVVEVDPVDQKYTDFCASCHGAEGAGDGPAGSALKPPPRNFVDWEEDVTDEYIAKVIREGGPAVGKSASMAPWGSVLNDEELAGMVKKIRAFRKQ